MRHTISVLVENEFGVLARVAGLFSGRGFNIESLSVAETLDPTVSRITLVTHGDDQVLEQIEKLAVRLAFDSDRAGNPQVYRMPAAGGATWLQDPTGEAFAALGLTYRRIGRHRKLGGLFVIITLSVVIQVGSFKLTGKRVFRMAPLHHHFEEKGWKESQVVVRFWILGILCAFVAYGRWRVAPLSARG